MPRNDDDLTSRKLFSVRQLWAMGAFVATCAATLTTGYFQLDAKASGAIESNKTLSQEVQTIKCLIRQQNYYQFYKRIPEWECK